MGNDTVKQMYYDHLGGDGVTLLPSLMRPKSRGTIRLKSKNPMDHPIIDPHYLEDPQDLKTLIESLKVTKKIGESKHFKKAKLIPKECPICNQEHKPWSDEYYKCVIENRL